MRTEASSSPAAAQQIELRPGEGAGETGDLDVSTDMLILGEGAPTTVIDGGSIDRVLDVRQPDLNFCNSFVHITSGYSAGILLVIEARYH